MRIFFLLTMFWAFSCSQKPAQQGILSREQMAAWMLDIYIAEAKVELMMRSPDSSYRLFIPYQDSLMRVHAVNDSVLMKSYLYYLEKPEELEKIYDIVLDSLSVKEQRVRVLRRPTG